MEKKLPLSCKQKTDQSPSCTDVDDDNNTTTNAVFQFTDNSTLTIETYLIELIASARMLADRLNVYYITSAQATSSIKMKE